MAIQLKDLTQGVRAVRVRYNDDVCNVQYRPGANTVARAIEVQELMQEDGTAGSRIMVERLAELIAGWDLMDGDKPVPVTEKTLLALPMAFTNAIASAIMEDQNPPTTRKSGR